MNSTDLLRSRIRDIPDFPEPGILFRDITPLLQDPKCLEVSSELLAAPYVGCGVDLVVGIESRGFLFGPLVALRLGAGFAMARKAGKLPWETIRTSYQLEYGHAEIEMHRDAVVEGQRVVVLDDVIATGGTAAATARLVRQMGGAVAGAAFLIELGALRGRDRIADMEVHAVLTL
jgi:adenine phosphoribosyltransferase